MLIVIGSIAVLATLAGGAWQLQRLWRAVPRRNSDFGVI